MKGPFLYLILICLSFSSFAHAGAKHADSLLCVLDQTIKEKKVYSDKKDKDLRSIKELLRIANSNEQKYTISSQLFAGYAPYNNDSSLHYASEKLKYAQLINNPNFIEEAKFNIAESMTIAGMYKEVSDILDDLDVALMHEDLKPAYYHLCRKLYGLMEDYSITDKEIEYYHHLTDLYRDSLLLVYDSSSSVYAMVKADQCIVHGKPQEALTVLSNHLDKIEPYSHDAAYFNYSIAEAYEYIGDTEKAILHYTISSISDIQSGVKEYVSLRRLAFLLYEIGDVTRAYQYMKSSLEDAIECNARIRTMEVSRIFPLIDGAYQAEVRKQQQQMRLFTFSVSVLSFFLLIAILFVYRQMKKTAQARQAVVEANDRLKVLNKELNDSNWQLKTLNHALLETSQIKEEYIGRYMDICSTYIDKMDNYRRSLAKIAGSGKVEELYKTIKSTQFLDDELTEFYNNFDNTFLQLFPTFVDDFNALLTERLEPKAGERLNTELRIFALIRLGITDSNKIARFLRYSVTTIYNYRTRIRNRAKGERDEFEKKVSEIGEVSAK